MPRFLSLLPLAGFFSAALSAQLVNVNGGYLPPPDTRPFGKYLVQICTLSSAAPFTFSCDKQVPPPAGKMPQTISLKLVGCPPNTSPCPAPAYPLSNGASFLVAATSDSGLIVDQEVVHGNVTPQDGTGTQQYVVRGPETVVIRAKIREGQPNYDRYAPAAPVELALTVAEAAGDKTPAACAGLPGPTTASQIQSQIDLPGIIGLIGNPTPFVLTPQGSNTILIYSTRSPLNENEKLILGTIPSAIEQLAGRRADLLGIVPTPKPFKVELAIPHAAALGDLATRIVGLNYSQFTVQDIGGDRVRINAPSPPDCATWTAFLSAIRRMEWQVTSEPLDMKLYYLSSTDAAAAFTSLTAGSGASSAASGSAAGASAPAASTTPAAGTGGGGAATVAVNQSPGSVIELESDKTPCVSAGLTLGNGGGCAVASGPGGTTTAPSSGGAAAAPPKASAAAAAPKPPGMVAMAVAAGTGEQNPSDLLIFSDTNGGDDAQIMERKRILAQLDLPRPEMLINAWVMQNSTTNPRAMGMFSNAVRDMVAGYNDALEQILIRGLKFVQGESQKPDYFDRDYFSYIADRYIADTSLASAPTGVQAAAQAILSNSPAKLVDAPDDLNRQYGICPSGHYCLGYNSLFHPLKPRLTDFLLTLIAADKPIRATEDAIDAVQGPLQPVPNETACEKITGNRELRDRCRAIWSNLGLDREVLSSPPTCASHDYKDILGALLNNPPDPRERPRIYLACFRDAAETFLPNVGQLRAAIADFLFNYKMSQQYPHEFVPYELSQSADALNTALSPLIDAFNRDIIAFQTFMRADVQYQVDRLNNATDERCCVKRLFGLDKPSFFNDGIVSVRTISGQPTSVNTTSQSVLDASRAPSLSNLMNSIASPAGSGTSPLAGVLGSPQSSAALLAGVLNAYQTTYAQFGRSLQLQVVPRSLSTASTAEIAVSLNADETSGGPVYSGGPQGGAPPNTSRVANHDISTRIRVESVKLFEVSSFSAIVQRSRSRFPLLPPFVEIPYIGTIAGIPIAGAKEYHGSTAVMSAMVVPTAADIAYGLRFVFDQVVDGDPGSCSFVKDSAGPSVPKPCRFRRAVSMLDLSELPIGGFHKAMIHCFATGMKSPYSSVASLISTDTSACKSLSFGKLPQDEY
ncbi:MAG: hypothetical protein WBL61_18455 [Bryobacteraceae bacterium]